jgi:hypothetical protein
VYATRRSLALFKRLPHSSKQIPGNNTNYIISDDAPDRTAHVADFVLTITMLVLPLWILQTLEGLRWKLAIITLFIVLCFAFLTIATQGRPFERLAATAG